MNKDMVYNGPASSEVRDNRFTVKKNIKIINWEFIKVPSDDNGFVRVIEEELVAAISDKSFNFRENRGSEPRRNIESDKEEFRRDNVNKIEVGIFWYKKGRTVKMSRFIIAVNPRADSTTLLGGTIISIKSVIINKKKRVKVSIV